MQEKWRPVVGYEGLYEVSNLGRVRRIRIVEPTKKKHGYMQISLVGKDGVRRSHRLHRIVATAFIPNPEGKPQVNHRDENPENKQAQAMLEAFQHAKNHPDAEDFRELRRFIQESGI